MTTAMAAVVLLAVMVLWAIRPHATDHEHELPARAATCPAPSPDGLRAGREASE
ncbi:hypothetical protein [Streptomyces sp. SudanB182_2057]|uniref:hypothetical protein n=1 Tax=Streptomyces sp. SudanB182_2057 TaxID=3035281 RepID=UPI003F55B851